jgi:hypothetical protein
LNQKTCKIGAALAALLLCACAGPQMRESGVTGGSVELSGTPFFPQEQYQCGPAALGEILAADGVPLTPDELVSQVYIPERKGSLQTEMIAAARRYERVPYVLRPDHLDVIKELRDGHHPVLVLQNLGLGEWHYAVVVGVYPELNQFVLRSGRERRQFMKFGPFLTSWRDGRFWSMVATSPGDIPASATMREWIAAAAPFEQLNKPKVAAEAYLAATRRWPDEALPWQALGNARYAQHDLIGATEALAAAARLKPDDAASHNNLAQVLIERACAEQAEDEINRALSLETDPERVQIYAKTKARVRAYSGPSVVCPQL